MQKSSNILGIWPSLSQRSTPQNLDFAVSRIWIISWRISWLPFSWLSVRFQVEVFFSNRLWMKVENNTLIGYSGRHNGTASSTCSSYNSFFNGLLETAKGTHEEKDVDLLCPFERGQRLNKVIVIFLAYLHSEQICMQPYSGYTSVLQMPARK